MGSKQSLLMKFGQFMSYAKRNNFIKKLYKKICEKCDLETSSFCYEIFEAIYLCYICISKAIEISPNQYTGLLRFLFTEDSLKIEKGLELVSRSHFSNNFSEKNCIL